MVDLQMLIYYNIIYTSIYHIIFICFVNFCEQNLTFLEKKRPVISELLPESPAFILFKKREGGNSPVFLRRFQIISHEKGLLPLYIRP